MARERDDDYDDRPRRRDEDYSDSPRRSRRDDDDFDYDRPRRRRRDDDDDYEDRPKQLSGLDATFHNTNVVVLVLFCLLCGGIAFLLGIIGLCTCKDPKARSNALIATIVGGIMTGLGTIFQIMANL